MSSDDEVRGELRFRPERQKTAELPHVDVRQLELLLQSMRPPGRSFGELAKEWHSIRAKTLVEPRNEERHIRHMAPLHELTEAELLPRKVEEVLSGLLKENGGKLSRSTCNKIRGTGMQVVQAAIANREWTQANPFELTRRLKNPKPTTWNVLSLEEARQLLPWLRRALWREVVASLLLGFRPGELKALRREDVDLKAGTIHIRRSNARNATKTGRNRLVPIPDQLRPIIEEALRVSLSDLVFPDPCGKLQRFDAKKTKAVRTALKRAGLDKPRFRFLDLRHTSATLHREAGADPLVVKLALGHSTNSVTDDWYSHLGHAYQLAELNKLRLFPEDEPEGKKEVDGGGERAQGSASFNRLEPTMGSPAICSESGTISGGGSSAGRTRASQACVDETKSPLSSESLLSVQDVADYLKVSTKHVRKLAARGDLPFFVIATAFRFRPEDVRAFVDKAVGDAAP